MKPLSRVRSAPKSIDQPILKILLLEDDPIDAELIESMLSNGEFTAQLFRAESRQRFMEILTQISLDLILSDYILPDFDGFSALEIARRIRPEVPFIIISGVLGEEQAIEALKQGATDYVLKHRLARLLPAIERALQEKRERQKRLQLEASLHETDNLLKAIVNASPIAIFTLTPDGRVMTWNAMAEQIYGWQAYEVLDRPLPLVPEYQNAFFQQLLHQALQSHTLVNIECQHLRKDGSLVDISISLAPLHTVQGEVYGVVLTAVNLAGCQQATDDRLMRLWYEQKAHAALESANRIKDEFLGIISHELRTPLNAILGWVKLIQKNSLSSTVMKQAVEVIERNATLQAKLIEDLLDMSRILQGNLRLTVGCVDMAVIIRAALETLQPAIAAKSIAVHCQIADSVVLVSGDPDRLQQVIWNLLSNAIKFTPEGGQITIRLTLQDTQAQVQVSDTGIGIEADFLPYVFEYFRQADASTTRFYNGLGLGLAISRYLVELHGGTLQAESLGKDLGATFTLRVPIHSTLAVGDRPPEAFFPLSDRLLNRVSLKGLKVILLEGQLTAAIQTPTDLAKRLSQHGARVVVAHTVPEAQALLELFKPDLLIVNAEGLGLERERAGQVMGLRSVSALSQQFQEIPVLLLKTEGTEADEGTIDPHPMLINEFQLSTTRPLETTKVVTAICQLTASNLPSRDRPGTTGEAESL
jgi:PAS domain S-box-containing protein